MIINLISLRIFTFLKNIFISGFNKLGLKYPQLNLIQTEYRNGKRKDFLFFLLSLSIKNFWYSLNNWDEQIWIRVRQKNVKYQEYLSVLTASQIIFSDFDDMSDQKIYIVYTKVAAPDNPHKYFDYTCYN